jgi:hypothetical protein
MRSCFLINIVQASRTRGLESLPQSLEFSNHDVLERMDEKFVGEDPELDEPLINTAFVATGNFSDVEFLVIAPLFIDQ